MKAQLIKIGNSRGIRLPKPLIEEAGLEGTVELRARKGEIVIKPAEAPRSGWAQAAQELRQREEDRLLDLPTPTRFDKEEWEW